MKNQAKRDQHFMLEVLRLARKGTGYVSPNPLVGCVLLNHGTIIGKGYHRYYGGDHAEVNAIRTAGGNPRGATLYVNLEPCVHHGKTPPCTDFIIRSGIKRVVIGMRDPNPLVSGKGILMLRKAGIKVDTGILRSECEKLNEVFAKYITQRSPFIALKIAQTINGKISIPRARGRWITNTASRNIVHTLRSEYDAVLIGAGTVRTDNPKLTVRHVPGRNPMRVILDGSISVSTDSAVFSRSAETIILVAEEAAEKKKNKVKTLCEKGAVVVPLPANKMCRIPLRDVLKLLADRGIASLMVEGGADVFNEFIRAKLVDKYIIFIAPLISNGGLDVIGVDGDKSGFLSRLKKIEIWNINENLLVEGYT